MITHIWTTRALCPTTGYFWTNPSSPNIICSCNNHKIIDNIIITGDAVTDESAFRAAVCADINVEDADLNLIQG